MDSEERKLEKFALEKNVLALKAAFPLYKNSEKEYTLLRSQYIDALRCIMSADKLGLVSSVPVELEKHFGNGKEP